MFKGKHCVHIYSGKKVQQHEERMKKADKQNKAKQQHNTGLRND
jgi:hypothetical protein